MCNKRRTSSKLNSGGIIFQKANLWYTAFIFCLLAFGSCERKPGLERYDVIKTEFPKLSDDIVERNFDGLWEFTKHDNEHVRSLAWKAIIKSETDDIDSFFAYAIQHGDSSSWHALSFHPLTREKMDTLNQFFSEDRIQSESVCEVFFRKGNLNSLELLIDKPAWILESDKCSQAVGGILSRIQVDDSTKRKIFDMAFNSEDETIRRNLLYGFYRDPLNRPQSGSVMLEYLSTKLNRYGESVSIQTDEFLVRIAGRAGFMNVMDRRSGHELNQAVQLSNELARNVNLLETDELNHHHVKRLLNHPVNPVVVQTLQSLQEFEKVPENLLDWVDSEIVSHTPDAEIFAEALSLLTKHGKMIKHYRTKLDSMDAKNEYLKHKMLPLFAEIEPEAEYLKRIQREVSEGGIGGMQAVQTLTNDYVKRFPENPALSEKVRPIVQFALDEGDRSVISALNIPLTDPHLFGNEDLEWLNRHYIRFVENAEWEKAKALDEILGNRFQNRFVPMPVPERPFRIPDWNRLYEMGTEPIWVLETDKGIIEIQLYPLTAPFTVSSIDSLTRAGAYNNVPFHRVVRNFVIQGGDTERKDGLGVPGYRLPTEPSIQSFERGMVGIASSGTDTEGSQFFVMLGWAPHLDGNYTIFGKVTKGMEVADRIQIGDRVMRAKIYLR